MSTRMSNHMSIHCANLLGCRTDVHGGSVDGRCYSVLREPAADAKLAASANRRWGNSLSLNVIGGGYDC